MSESNPVGIVSKMSPVEATILYAAAVGAFSIGVWVATIQLGQISMNEKVSKLEARQDKVESALAPIPVMQNDIRWIRENEEKKRK